jgi:hypothetical protein
VHAATQSPLAHDALQRIAALYANEATIRGSQTYIHLKVGQVRGASAIVDTHTRTRRHAPTAVREMVSRVGNINSEGDVEAAVA